GPGLRPWPPEPGSKPCSAASAPGVRRRLRRCGATARFKRQTRPPPARRWPRSEIRSAAAAGCFAMSPWLGSALLDLLDHGFGHLAHAQPAVHGGLLDPAERLGLGQPHLGDQQALGPIHQLAGLELLAE